MRLGDRTFSAGNRVTRRAAFTLVELLVVISIIALLIAILVPALNGARQRARMLVCVSNVRSQMAVFLMYASDHLGALPPRAVWYETDEGLRFELINVFLARYARQEFQLRDGDLLSPTGIWRCPDVGPADPGRWTHTGVIHHSPNRWLLNFVSYNADGAAITSEAPAGWEDRFGDRDGNPEWRRLERVARPSDVLTLMDTVSYFVPIHRHTHAREYFGYAKEIVHESVDPAFATNEGSHDALLRRPTGLLDGHAEALPSTIPYWFDLPVTYRSATQPGVTLDTFQEEARRLMWFLEPREIAR